MKNNSTDLLVFDMIMAPNIVPLEVYRRIAEQSARASAAISASGFS
jgi:hypothetical protein